MDFKAFSAEIVGVQDNATRNMIICRVTIIQLIAGPTVVGLSEQPYSWQADISLATMLEFKPKEIELAQYMEATWYTFQGIDYNLYGKTRATIHIIRGGGGGAGVDGGHTLELSWEIEPEEDVVVCSASSELNGGKEGGLLFAA